MKVIVSESLGLEYVSDVISSCDQNGMQAIADNQNNEILFYDPKNKQYCTLKDLMSADYSIHDVFVEKEARDQVMRSTSGQGFEEFAVKWDALQKTDDPDVIKTKNCSMIRFSANEGKKPRIVGTRKPSKEFMDKVEQFRKKWKSLDDKKKDDELGDDGLTQADRDHLERLKHSRDDFGMRVNGIEAQVSERSGSQMADEMDDQISDWYRDAYPTDAEMADEMEVKGATFNDLWRDLNLGRDIYKTIGADDSIVRERVFQRLSELTGKQYRTIYKMWLKSANESGKDEKFIPLDAARRDARKHNEKEPYSWDDDDEWGDDADEFRPVCDQFEENVDDPRDWSASEGEVEIVWTTDFPEYQIEVGDTDHFVVDFDVVLPNDYDIESNCLKEEVCRLIRDEYPGIDVEEYDFDITNEKEFWGNQAVSRIYPYDE